MALFQVTKGVERKNELIYSASEIQNRSVQQDKSLEIQAVLLKVILEIPLFMPLLVINQTWENLLSVWCSREVFRLGQTKTFQEVQEHADSFMGTNF